MSGPPAPSTPGTDDSAWVRHLWPWTQLLSASALVLGVPTLASPSADDHRVPARLGAASNFAQGWNPFTLRSAQRLSVVRFRDALRWADIEREKGQYRFASPTSHYPDALARQGARLTLTLNWGNPLYDGGNTPHSPEAVAAFARFALAAVRRFPAVDTLEIGNEINGANFVRGPVKAAPPARRASYHLALVRAVASAIGKERPDIAVLGGATHSLPAGFLWPLVKQDRSHAITGLALHPYTTPIDQLRSRITFLRQSAQVRQRQLHITEFASRSPKRASDDLIRAYATLASLQIAEFDWYPLNERHDGHVPLLDRSGKATGAGEAFRFAAIHLAPYPARDVSPSPFTSVHAFGNKAWVLWGAERPFDLDEDGVRAFNARGHRLPSQGLRLSEDRAIILLTDSPRANVPVNWGCSPLVADSRLEFTYPVNGDPGKFRDPFTRLVQVSGALYPLEVMPGQQRKGVPWNPYLGSPHLPALHLDGIHLHARFGRHRGALVLHTAVPAGAPLQVQVELTGKESADITIGLDADTLRRATLRGASRIIQDIPASRPRKLRVTIAPSSGQRQFTAGYRIQILAPGRCHLPPPRQEA